MIHHSSLYMADLVGLEPTTFGFGDQRSSQLELQT